MTFFNKAGSLLRQTLYNKHVSIEGSASNLSMFQMIRHASNKVFVGGLSYTTDDTSLRETFEKYGYVVDAKIIKDFESGNSKGFGFVTYDTVEDANSAIQALDDTDLHGRRIAVREAHERPRGSGYAGGRYGAGESGGRGYDSRGYGGGGSGGGYGSGGGSGYGNSDNHGNGGGNYAGGGGYGNSDNHGNGGGNYAGGGGGGGGYGTGSSTGGSNVSYGNGQTFGAASGVGSTGGNDYAASAGYGGGNTNFGYSGGNQFGNSESSNVTGAGQGYSQSDPLEGNFKDDNDDAGAFANRS